jgi:hypothetical protein
MQRGEGRYNPYGDFHEEGKFNFSKKAFFIFAVIFAILITLILIYLPKLNFSIKNSCGDGTLKGECSEVKPYFCSSRGQLIENPSFCGCPENFSLIYGECISEFSTNPKKISLKYTLRGEENKISFTVYEGMKDYVSTIPRSIYSSGGNSPSKADFKLKAINDEKQREFLLPLLIDIQNITNDKADQMRIAVSLIQNIPYGNSNSTVSFFNQNVSYSRYPYETLYDNEGVCGEKTDLINFLLKELNYGFAVFYYPEENHEAVGIKCPTEISFNNTGFCFVETSGPAIITDNQIDYIGAGRLTSNPEILNLSDGESIGQNLYEYMDAKDMIALRNSLNKKGSLNFLQKIRLNQLDKKYGLAEIYNI